jgi:hypothetical protein
LRAQVSAIIGREDLIAAEHDDTALAVAARQFDACSRAWPDPTRHAISQKVAILRHSLLLGDL